jgi:hypothetical protein
MSTVDIYRQNAYNVGMTDIQYTIRSIPKNLDLFLRRQAKLQSKSLNQTVLDYIKQATKLDMTEDDEGFDWIIGANTIDDETLKAIKGLKEVDKHKSRI